jgi:hypothetical protein
MQMFLIVFATVERSSAGCDGVSQTVVGGVLWGTKGRAPSPVNTVLALAKWVSRLFLQLQTPPGLGLSGRLLG